MSQLTFRTILADAVATETKAQGVTAAFFNLSKMYTTWAQVAPLIEQCESEHKEAKRGPLPGVWRNAKSVIKNGMDTIVDGDKSVFALSSTFNEVKDKLKILKAAKDAAEKAETAEGKADTLAGALADKTATIPECLKQFVAACMADATVAAYITDEMMADLFDQIKAAATADAELATIAALETGTPMVATAH